MSIPKNSLSNGPCLPITVDTPYPETLFDPEKSSSSSLTKSCSADDLKVFYPNINIKGLIELAHSDEENPSLGIKNENNPVSFLSDSFDHLSKGLQKNDPNQQVIEEFADKLKTAEKIGALIQNCLEDVDITQLTETVIKELQGKNSYFYPFFSKDNPKIPIFIKVDLEKGEISIINPLSREKGYIEPSIVNKQIESFHKSLQITVIKANKEKLKSNEFISLLTELSIQSRNGKIENPSNISLFSSFIAFVEGDFKNMRYVPKEFFKKVSTVCSMKESLLSALYYDLLEKNPSPEKGIVQYKKITFLLEKQALASIREKLANLKNKEFVSALLNKRPSTRELDNFYSFLQTPSRSPLYYLLRSMKELHELNAIEQTEIEDTQNLIKEINQILENKSTEPPPPSLGNRNFQLQKTYRPSSIYLNNIGSPQRTPTQNPPLNKVEPAEKITSSRASSKKGEALDPQTFVIQSPSDLQVLKSVEMAWQRIETYKDSYLRYSDSIKKHKEEWTEKKNTSQKKIEALETQLQGNFFRENHIPSLESSLTKENDPTDLKNIQEELVSLKIKEFTKVSNESLKSLIKKAREDEKNILGPINEQIKYCNNDINRYLKNMIKVFHFLAIPSKTDNLFWDTVNIGDLEKELNIFYSAFEFCNDEEKYYISLLDQSISAIIDYKKKKNTLEDPPTNNACREKFINFLKNHPLPDQPSLEALSLEKGLLEYHCLKPSDLEKELPPKEIESIFYPFSQKTALFDWIQGSSSFPSIEKIVASTPDIEACLDLMSQTPSIHNTSFFLDFFIPLLFSPNGMKQLRENTDLSKRVGDFFDETFTYQIFESHGFRPLKYSCFETLAFKEELRNEYSKKGISLPWISETDLFLKAQKTISGELTSATDKNRADISDRVQKTKKTLSGLLFYKNYKNPLTEKELKQIPDFLEFKELISDKVLPAYSPILSSVKSFIQEEGEKLPSNDPSYDTLILRLSVSFKICSNESVMKILGKMDQQKEYWANIPNDKIEDVLENFSVILEKMEKRRDQPGVIVSQYILMISDLLARKDPRNKLENVPLSPKSLIYGLQHSLQLSDNKMVCSLRKALYDYYKLDPFELKADLPPLFSSLQYPGQKKGLTERYLNYLGQFIPDSEDGRKKIGITNNMPKEKKIQSLLEAVFSDKLDLDSIFPNQVKLLQKISLCAEQVLTEDTLSEGPFRVLLELEFKMSNLRPNNILTISSTDLPDSPYIQVLDGHQITNGTRLDPYSQTKTLDENNKIEALNNLDPELIADCQSISYNPFNEVSSLLSFARRTLSNFDKPFYKDLLYLHLFRAERLEFALKLTPDLPEKIDLFFKESFDFSMTIGDYERGSWFLLLKSKVENRINDIQRSKSEPLPAWTSNQSLIEKMTNHSDLKAKQIGKGLLFYENRDALKENPLSKEAIVGCFYAHYLPTGLSKILDVPSLNESMEQVKKSLEKSTEVPLGAIGQILIDHGIASTSEEWVRMPDTLEYQEKQQNHQLNFSSGSAFFMSENIWAENIIDTLCPNETYQQRLNTRTYTPSGIKVTLTDYGYKIEKKIGDELYEYGGLLDEKSYIKNFLLNFLEIPEGYTIWAKTGTDQIDLHLEKKKATSLDLVLKKSHYNQYTIDPDPNLPLIYENHTLRSFLKPVASDLRVKVRNSQIETVLAGDLSFSLVSRDDNQLELESENYEGYFITRKTLPPLLSENLNASFLILENTEGKMKVLFYPERILGLQTGLITKKPIAIDFDEKGIAKASSSNEELLISKFMLSYFYLQQEDFLHAFEEIPISEGLYSEGVRVLLSKLIQECINTPVIEKKTYGLKLYSMLIKNMEKGGVNIEAEKTGKIKPLTEENRLAFLLNYEDYLNQHDNLEKISLSPLEESSLLRHLLQNLPEDPERIPESFYNSERTWDEYEDAWKNWGKEQQKNLINFINPFSIRNFKIRLEERLALLDRKEVPKGTVRPLNIPDIAMNEKTTVPSDWIRKIFPNISSRTLLLLEEEKEDPWEEFELLNRLVELYKKENFEFPSTMIWTELNLPKDFLLVYDKILSGTREDRKKIEEFLKIQTPLMKPDALLFVDRLKKVLLNRKKFPTVEKLKNLRQVYIDAKKALEEAKPPKEKQNFLCEIKAQEKKGSLDPKNISEMKKDYENQKEKYALLKKNLESSEKAYRNQIALLAPKKPSKMFKTFSKIKGGLELVSALGKKIASLKAKEQYNSLMKHAFTKVERLDPLTYEQATKVGDPVEKIKIAQEDIKNIDSGFDLIQQYFLENELSQTSSFRDLKNLEVDISYNKKAFEDLKKYRERIQRTPTRTFKVKDSFFSTLPSLLLQEEEKLGRVDEKLTEAMVEKDPNDLIDSKSFIAKEGLKALLGKGTIECFQEYTGWSRQKIEKVASLYMEYLALNTRILHLKKVENEAKILQQLEQNSPEYTACLERTVSLLEQKRGYEINFENRFHLLFEEANAILIQKIQWDKMDQIENLIEEGSNVLAEMKTGFGKTAVVVRALLKKIAEGEFRKKSKSLVVFICPSSLIGPDFTNTQRVLEKAYGSKTDYLDFSREMNFTPHGLKNLHNQLLEDIKKGTPLFMTSETARAIQHHFLLSLEQLQSSPKNKDYQKISEELGNILRILKKSKAFIDEADKELRPGQVVQWPIALKENLSKRDIAVICDLFKDLPQEILQAIQNNRQCYIFPKHKQHIQNSLLEAAAKKLQLTGERKTQFEQFVLKGGNPEAFSSDASLYKGLITSLIPSALEKNVDEHYGFSKQHKNKVAYAIPWDKGVPKETEKGPSQLKNPHETLVKTLITYIHKGIDKEQASTLLKALKNDLKQKKTEVYEIIQNMNLNYNLLTASDQEIEKQALAIAERKDPFSIQLFVEKFVAPSIAIYPKAFSADAQNMRSMFGSTVSVTATPQDPEAVSANTINLKMDEVQGEFLHLLEEKCVAITVLEGEESEGCLKNSALHVKSQKNIKAVVDEGGLLKGLSQKTVLQAYHESLPKQIEEIVYFDNEANNFLAFDRKNFTTIPYETSKTLPKNRFVIYDQSRSVGADIKMPDTENTVFLLHLGNDSTFTSIQQAAGRARGLSSKQKLELIIPKDLAQKICKEDRVPTNAEITRFLLENEEQARLEYNFASIKQQMSNEIRDHLIDLIIDIEGKSCESKKMLAEYQTFKNELIEKGGLDPVLLYGYSSEISMQNALDIHEKKCFNLLDKLSLTGTEKRKIKAKISFCKKKFTGDGKVKGSGEGEGESCNVNLEQNQQQEQEQEQQEELDQNQSLNQAALPSERRKEIFWTIPNINQERKWLKISKITPSLLTMIYDKFPLKEKTKQKDPIEGEKGKYRYIPDSLSYIGSCITFIPKTLFKGVSYAAKTATRSLSSKRIEFFKVRDVMKTSFPGKDYQLFSKNLLATNNFWDVKNTRAVNFNIKKQVPFNDQKGIQEVLVTKDKKGKFFVILIDPIEALYFTEQIREKKADSVWLFDINQGVVKGNSDFDSIKNNPLFARCIAEVKLIGGRGDLITATEAASLQSDKEKIKGILAKQSNLARAEFEKNRYLADIKID